VWPPLDWLRRLADIGALPSDSEELRLRKRILVLSSTLIACLALAWVATFAALGLWVSAALPFSYQLASAIGIYAFARTRRYRLFRRSQLWTCLVLPFALQWSLGGFRNSSAVCLWGFTSPLGALLFVGTREAFPWLFAFVGLVLVSGAIDPAVASAPHIPNGVVVTFFVLNVAGVTATAYVLLQYFVGERDREQARSERLLLNVLPSPVAARLKHEEGVIADACAEVTVLFADIVDFTPLSERLAAEDLVAVLDRVFAAWDRLAARYGVEKIKTIGDAYMVASGIPLPREDHVEAIAEMALAMGPSLARVAIQTGLPLQTRIGIDTGPVVAGVIGRSKFIYDLWGDTVNTASRMESHGLPGTINVTPRTHDRLRQRYELRPRGTIEIKGKGSMNPYLLIGRHDKRQRSTSGQAVAAPEPASSDASDGPKHASDSTGVKLFMADERRSDGPSRRVFLKGVGAAEAGLVAGSVGREPGPLPAGGVG
jgi:adenylate cyclase